MDVVEGVLCTTLIGRRDQLAPWMDVMSQAEIRKTGWSWAHVGWW